jgi:hypothetical protein
MRNPDRLGMCSRCIESQMMDKPGVGPQRRCTRYHKWCKQVARNCKGPAERRS